MTIHISHSIFKAGLEIYHLQCAREEYGDRRIINKIANHYVEDKNLSDLEAFRRAVSVIENVDDLINRKYDFKSIRRELVEESAINHEQENLLLGNSKIF